VLHTSPEAAVGGPLAVVQSGDMIELDVAARRIHLDISDDELAARLATWTAEKSGANPRPASGYAQLYHDRVLGADTGADFDFLVGCRGNAVGKEAH
jgi:dihydroxy-acid dehydratase